MTKSVDQKVVQMEFDNKQFKKGISETLKELTSLKKNLNMDKSTASLKSLESAGRRLNLGKVANNIATLSSRFSTLGIVGTTALVNIANRATNTGIAVLKSLTIDPIKTGLDEYETKINAITTILTNTRSKGTTLTDVNEALAELNEYADLTIYNFAEMTRNIGTFTAAGVDLKTATDSIKGIANLAAGSGSSAQQAATAMYQLSQAIAAGSVKLMDWNSVVNAGMGGELLQNALRDTAKEMGVVVDASIPFRESLQSGWLTSDILTTTLIKFTDTNTELGKSLTDAATQVKTMTQLFSVMQETVQSGWSVSWENIIGDRDQATSLLTAISDGFSDMVGPTADARNAALEYWNTLGGRANVIKGLTNLFNLYVAAVKPIKQAMADMFPRITGRRLSEMSRKFREFTDTLSISEETSEKLRSGFRGLFSLFKIGGLAVKSIWRGIGELLSRLKALDIDVLGGIDSFGKWAVKLYQAAEQSQFFDKVMDDIIDGITVFAVVIKNAAEGVYDWWQSLDKSDIVNELIRTFNELLEKFINLEELPKINLGDLIELPNLPEVKFGNTLENISAALTKFKDGVKAFFSGIEYEKLFNFLKRGAFATVLLSTLYQIQRIIGKSADVVKSFSDVLDSLSYTIKAYGKDLKANAFLKVAASIGILVASLIALTFVDPEKLKTAVIAMGAMLAELLIVMILFDKIVNKTKASEMIALGLAMASMSIGVVILVNAVRKIADIPTDKLGYSMLAMVAMMTGLVLMAKSLDKIDSNTILKKSIGLNAFATAILILVKVVERIGELDTTVLLKGLAGMGAIMVAMGLLLKYSDVAKLSTQSGVAVLAIAGGIWILTQAVQNIAGMEWQDITKGLLVVGTLLAGLGVFANYVNTQKGGLKSLGINLMGVSLAMVIMAGAMHLMSSLSWEEIGKGLLSITVGLGAMVLAVNLMKGGLAGAAAMVIVSGALVIFSGAMLMLAQLSWEQIAKGLVAILGGMAGIAGLSALLSPAIPFMLAFAAALILMGTSVGIFGASLVILGAGITALGVAIAGMVAIKVIIENFSKLLNGFVDVILKTSPKLARTALQMIVDMLKAMRDAIPEIADVSTDMIVYFMDGIARNMPRIVDSALNLIAVFIETLAYAIPEYGPRLLTAVDKLFWGLIDLVWFIITGSEADTKQTLIEWGKAFMAGLFELPRKVGEFFANLFKDIQESIEQKYNDIKEAAKNVMRGFVDGIVDGVDDAINAVKDFGNDVLTAVKDVFDIHSPSRETFKIGEYFDFGLGDGVIEAADYVINSVTTMGDKALEAAEPWGEEGFEIGQKLPEKMAEGIEDSTPVVEQAATKMGKTAFEKAVEWIDERKYYNELALTEELEEWQKLQGKYKEGTEERKRADKEVYRLKKELTEKMKAIDEEYYSSIDTLKEKYIQEVKDLNKSYDDALKERTQTIVDSFGLFEQVEEPEIIDGETLTANLKGQVEAIQDWRKNLEILSEKGVTDDLMKELQDMGPSAVAQIEALNKLSEPELDNYVSLWVQKNKEAKSQSVQELRGMRQDVKNQIVQLNKESGEKLAELKVTWQTQLSELTGVNKEELAEMRKSWDTEIDTLKTNTIVDFRQLQSHIKGMDWQSTGRSIVTGMTRGVNQNRSDLIGSIRSMVEQAKDVAEEVLDINSPSKVFEQIGKFTVMGMVKGIDKNAKGVGYSSRALAERAIDNVRQTIQTLATMVDEEINTNPVITPVLDLSEFKTTGLLSNGTLAISSDRARSISGKSSKVSTGDSSTKSSGDVKIEYNQTINSPKVLPRSEIYRNTNNSLSKISKEVRLA